MRPEALRLWRGHSRDEAAAKANVGVHVIRQYERRPGRVRSRVDRRRCRRYYAMIETLHAHERALIAMIESISAPESIAPPSAA